MRRGHYMISLVVLSVVCVGAGAPTFAHSAGSTRVSAAATAAPPVLTGDWTGTFKAIKNGKRQSYGTLTATVNPDLTFSGSGMELRSGNPFDIDGSFVQEGRLLSGTLHVSGQGIDETDTIQGKCNGNGTKMKWTFTSQAGESVKVKYVRP